MRIRNRPDAKTRCLYPKDVVGSIGSSPQPPSEEEEGEVSSKPAAASKPAKEMDPELERRKYKHLGWPSYITFSFIHIKTPSQDSSTNPDNNEDTNGKEVQSKSEKNKNRLSKTMVIGGGSGDVEDEKYDPFYDSHLRNSYIAFPSTNGTSSSNSSRQGDVKGTIRLNDEYEDEEPALGPDMKADHGNEKAHDVLLEESNDSEENYIIKTRSLKSIYKSTQSQNLVYNLKEENEMPNTDSDRSKKLKRTQSKN